MDNQGKTIIDISQSIYTGMPVYPGNPEVSIKEMNSSTGQSTISSVTFGSHTGTHIDAPRHVIEYGTVIDKIPLDKFFGRCTVIDCIGDTESVLRSTLEKSHIAGGDRILLKTNNSLRGFEKFYDDYVYISPEAATYLAKKKVTLVGIDSLSVKKRSSPDNTPHMALLENEIPIIEGLDLSKVQAGEYMLYAFPMKFKDGNGAPCRAILMK